MKKSISKLRKIYNHLVYSIAYYYESRKNFFPCKLTGEYRIDKNGKTVVEIKNFGNAKHFYIHVRKIFEDEKILEKFSSSDVSRITMAAYNEIFFSLDNETKKEEMNNIIHHSFLKINKKGKDS